MPSLPCPLGAECDKGINGDPWTSMNLKFGQAKELLEQHVTHAHPAAEAAAPPVAGQQPKAEKLARPQPQVKDDQITNFEDYIQFWRVIDASETEGHKNILKVLQDKKIHIGDSIPNVEVWHKLKKILNQNQPNETEPPIPTGNQETIDIQTARLKPNQPNYAKSSPTVNILKVNNLIPKEMGNSYKTDENDTAIVMETMGTDKHRDNCDDTDGYKPLNNTGDCNQSSAYRLLCCNAKNKKNKKVEKKCKLKDKLVSFGIKRDEIQNETVFKIILDNVCNGHLIILDILDGLVETNFKEKCSECLGNRADSKIIVDLCPMFKRYSDPKKFVKNKMRLVHELIEVQNERGDDKNIKKIFKHPVIEILILQKWEEKKLWYHSSVQMFTLFVFLFSFFVRLRILESNEINTIFYTALTGDNTFNFTVGAELNANTIINGKFLESASASIPVNMEIDRNFTASLFNSNNTSNMVVQFLTSYENGTFTAEILELNGTHFVTSPWMKMMKIFNNKKENVIIFAIVMGGLILSQILGVFIELVMNFEDEGIQNHNITVHRRNILYLLSGNFMCFISALDNGICLKLTLLFIWIRLTLLELGQLSVVVFEPAAKCCKNTGVRAFIQNIIRKRYWRDPENYLEILFLISVPLAIFVPDWELIQPNNNEERNSMIWNLRASCRGFIAIGVFSAWTELVIKMGNVSHSVVGDFIKMFYNIIKNNLFSYMKVCLVLITAFSLAFWVILEGQMKEGANFSSGFWFSQVLTTTMGTGEFNTGDFYEDIQGNGFTKVFAMLFLIGLICLITITMINLLVAAIINDYNVMKDEVDEENLYFIAEYIIECEKIQRWLERKLPTWMLDRWIGKNKLPQWMLETFLFPPSSEEWSKSTLSYCPHFICTKENKCENKLPIPRTIQRYNPEEEANERNVLLLKLLQIRGGMKGLCKYHQKKKAEDENSEQNE